MISYYLHHFQDKAAEAKEGSTLLTGWPAYKIGKIRTHYFFFTFSFFAHHSNCQEKILEKQYKSLLL
jgi:hypothetical protein